VSTSFLSFFQAARATGAVRQRASADTSCWCFRLLACFEGRELGEIDGQVFLGMYHERDWSTNTIYISQPKHVATVLSSFGACAKPVSSPLDHKIVLSATSDHDKQEHPQLPSYTALVGSLMYIASCTRPGLCYTASMLAGLCRTRVISTWRKHFVLCITCLNLVHTGLRLVAQRVLPSHWSYGPILTMLAVLSPADQWLAMFFVS
jgi:hypothetical protein